MRKIASQRNCLVNRRLQACSFVRRLQAFSLVELLAVIAVISILVSLAAPTLLSALSSRQFNSSVSTLSAYLEAARNDAISQNTYVWLGLVEDPTGSKLYVAEVKSQTGTSDLTSNLQTGNKASTLQNTNLRAEPNGNAGLQYLSANSIGSFTQKISGQDMTFNQIVRFSPAGEATTISGTLPLTIQIDLNEVRGTKTQSNNSASISIQGVSGKVLVSRN